MFGYVIANQSDFSESEQTLYRGTYCGLCKAIGQRRGLFEKMFLSYDYVFMIHILSDIYRQPLQTSNQRCWLHPLSKQEIYQNAVTDYAADMNVLLAYYNLKDKWKDDKSTSAFLSQLVIADSAKAIAQIYPRQSKSVLQHLAILDEMEQQDEQNPDLPASVFGSMMEDLFYIYDDDYAPLLQSFGFYLGKAIYLCDAAADLKADLQRGRYNPFMSTDVGCIDIIVRNAMNQLAQKYEELPLEKYKTITDNIVYSGMLIHYQQAVAQREKELQAARQKAEKRHS